MLYGDPSGEFIEWLIIGAVAVVGALVVAAPAAAAYAYAGAAKTVNQVTTGLVRTINANAGAKAIANALKKNPLGYIFVELGGTLVKVLTDTQAKAVADSQKYYDQLKSAEGPAAKALAEKLAAACRDFLGIKEQKKEPGASKADTHNIEDYYRYKQYGFDDKTTASLKKLRNGINRYFSDLPQTERDYLYSHMVGRMAYGSHSDSLKDIISWDGASGFISTPLPHKETMLFALGFSEEEFRYLDYHVRLQNQFSADKGDLAHITTKDKTYAQAKSNMEYALGRKLSQSHFERLWSEKYDQMNKKGDYAHSQITAASILNPYAGGVVHDLAMSVAGTDEEGLKDMAGWLGDATIPTEDGPTSFGNDDYMADLDAENITAIMKKEGIGYEKAESVYHERLNSGETRASLFLQSNDYKGVEKEVLTRLGIKDLKTLKKEHPDSYNFLMSLKNNQNEMQKY